jgi:hypothetical protein
LAARYAVIPAVPAPMMATSTFFSSMITSLFMYSL